MHKKQKTLRVILGDQLSTSIATLSDFDKRADRVLMVEVNEETTYVRHHKQKLVLILSAMRHFADDLKKHGVKVEYIRLDDEANTGSFTSEIKRALQRRQYDQLVVTEPGEWRVREMMRGWQEDLGIPVEIREDNRFLCSLPEFAQWAEGRKSLRMEYFYRTMRRKTGWLMEGDKPVGGQWNYDKQNRKPLPKGKSSPKRLRFEADKITRDVISLVDTHFDDHFGDLEPFGWATKRADALRALNHFIEECLPGFGDYQDAMKSGEDFLFHALLSPYINIGLLDPREVCEAALEAFEDDRAPIAAVEGFIRQILGWREYIRGFYWLQMPAYKRSNYLEAERPLPDFFWTAETDMNCLRQAIETTRRHGYAHHIQRLMITGNFALLASLAPGEVEDWYLQVYVDAFEWVELPNTHGMALFADGGILASKPYSASGAYINRMSDYCSDCRFNPGKKLGEGACPFNYLYWNFLISKEHLLKTNPRMGLAYRNLSIKSEAEIDAIKQQSEAFLQTLGRHDAQS
jgi:deoxyribodipyrimidine photolyase-related protein